MRVSKKSLAGNEQGMAAIVLTTVLMLVISLIVIGYAHSIRLAQRNALDAQLSTQAFYAAESGVNLARKVINDQLHLNANANVNKTDCGDSGSYAGQYPIDNSTNSAIHCLLVKSDLSFLTYSGVGATAKITKLKATSGNPITSITFSWESSAAGTFNAANCASGVANQPVSWSCNEPLLRVDVVPLGAGTGLSQSGLQSSQYTAFLYPDADSASPSADAYSAGGVHKVLTNCSNAPNQPNLRCTATITGLNSAQYAVRMMGLYKPANIQVNIVTVTPNDTISGAEYQIDSTAQAADVVRRIKTYISAGSGSSDDFPLQTDAGDTAPGAGVCKQLTITGNTVTSNCGF